MSVCNNAFTALASKVDDILGANFDKVPRGDKTRVTKMANYLLTLLSNALESLTWVNTR